MPIVPTLKIWMNDEMVDWDCATVRIGTHTLHYAIGIFGGVRAYETDNGPGLFRLTQQIERLYRSARILGLPVPYSVPEIVAATKEESSAPPACPPAMCAPWPISAMARWVWIPGLARWTSPSWPGAGHRCGELPPMRGG